MFDWLRRNFRRSGADERERFFETVDALNAEAGGGDPTETRRSLGRLKLRSGTLALGDPQCVLGLEVPNFAGDEVEISASLWRYPSGAETITALSLSFGGPTGGAVERKVGEVGIDSAKLVVADKADIEEHWSETGKDRIGVISTAPDDSVLRLLTKRFKLKTRRVNPVRAEVVGPVSEQLVAEIECFLKANPKYADYPFMYFHLQTNNSFDRVNYLDRAWQFMPVGNSHEPLMFVCGTGHGDGCYDVQGKFDGDVVRVLTINFIES
ncbi:hypothetical protein BH10PLA2_BH10PLA2_20620 [soil metagenome]